MAAMNNAFANWWRELSAEDKRAAAAALESTQGHLNNIAGGMRSVSNKFGVGIERLTQGRLPVETTCPEQHWVRIPDPAWPWHPGGRPLIDVMPAAAPSNPAPRPPAAKSARAIKQRKQAMTAPRACPAARQLGVIGDTAVLTASAAIADVERRVECPLSDLRERRGKKRRGTSAASRHGDAKPSNDAERAGR